MPTRILVVDDHTIVRKGISMFLDTEPSVQIVGEAGDGQDAIQKASWLKPDVILLDLVMPNGDGINVITELKARVPTTKIIVITSCDLKEKVDAAMKAGANGYLLKDADGEALIKAIQIVQAGGKLLHPVITNYFIKNVVQGNRTERPNHLTGREKEILLQVANGLSNKAVAETLSLSEGTVKVHVSNILSKLNASNRTEAALSARQMGLISIFLCVFLAGLYNFLRISLSAIWLYGLGEIA